MTGPVFGADWPAAHLYDTTGQTFITDLTNARGIKWLDESSKPGTGSFEVPLDDAAGIGDRSIVKFSWKGAIRFAVQVKTESCQLAADGRRWLRFETQPGVLGLLDEAVILPEYGLTRTSGRSRTFGFMSADGPWRNPGEWETPVAISWTTAGSRHHLPTELGPSNPYWIAAFPGSETIVPGFTTHYFRREFSVGVDTNVEILTTADDEISLYLDGELIAEARDSNNRFGWRNCMSITTPLAPGNHLLAALVADDAPGSLIGFIMTVYVLDSQGNRTTVLLKSDTNWIVMNGTDNPPGWRRAQVLKKLVEEAQDRGSPGPSALTVGFDDSSDSAGTSWADNPGELPLPITTVGLGDVASQLSESEMDVAVDPDTMTLNAWVRRGSDLSGSVAVTLGSGQTGNAKSYETTKDWTRRTVVITQMANGRWVETVDPAAGSVGRIEVGLDLGTVNNATTATDVANAQLGELATQLVAITGEAACSLTGAVPYVDYNNGDTITCPGHRNIGTLKARVLAITVDATGDTVRAWPELVEDRSV